MATNSGRGNIIDAADDAPRGGDMDPPPVSSEVKGAVAKEASAGGGKMGSGGTGVHASGQEPGMQPDPTPKVEEVPEDRHRDRDRDRERAA
ncbi:hypothetical protein F4801DRAFT_535921 [Xylaria longipes]|nr:hypothetical protein F4801DRAFT_535921 [Xylaria longipes]